MKFANCDAVRRIPVPELIQWSCSPISPSYHITTVPGKKKTGREVPCFICGKSVYKCAAYLARDYKRITCGDSLCKSQKFIGENNPYWGKVHDEETRKRIREGRRARPPSKKTGPPKGYNHTPEARAKITEALKRRWRENRDKMLAAVAKGAES